MAEGAFGIVMDSRKELVEKILYLMKSEGQLIVSPKWNRAAMRPHNPLSDINYRGGNRLRLMMEAVDHGYQDSRWATLKQYREKGYLPKKGEHGVLCEKWIFEKEVWKEGTDGKMIKEREKLERPIVSYFKVFNGEQIQDFPVPVYQNQYKENDVMELADRFIATSECPIQEIAQEQAYYNPVNDEIVLPIRAAFRDEICFAKTVIHEMGHSTGHSSRLNRDLSGSFGSQEYAREELRAEIGALFVGADLGMPLQEEHYIDHSTYLKSWIRALETDYNELYRACADAEKINSRLLNNYEKKYTIERLLEKPIPLNDKKPTVMKKGRVL